MSNTLPKNIEEAVNGLIAPWNLNLSVLLEKSKSFDPRMDNPSDMQRWLSVDAAEKYSGCGRWTLARAIKAGKIKSSKLSSSRSGKVLIERASVDAWLERCRWKPST